MSLNESIVEDAALEWFGEQSRYARTLIPAFCLRLSPLRSGSHGEREKREAIARLNRAIPEEAREMIWNFFISPFTSRRRIHP